MYGRILLQRYNYFLKLQKKCGIFKRFCLKIPHFWLNSHDLCANSVWLVIVYCRECRFTFWPHPHRLQDGCLHLYYLLYDAYTTAEFQTYTLQKASVSAGAYLD